MTSHMNKELYTYARRSACTQCDGTLIAVKTLLFYQ